MINQISSGSSQVSSPATVKGSWSTKPSETKLAKTGINAEIAATLVIVMTAIGAVVYIIANSRKEND